MRNKKILYGFLVVFVLVLVFATTLLWFELSESNELQKVKVGYKKHLAYTPIFIALENKYFEKHGLDVEPVIFDSTNQMLGAVISNNIDAVLGGANLQTIYLIEEKSPGLMDIFSTVKFNDGDMFSCVLTKEDSGINSINDLISSKIATLPGSFAPLWVKATFKENNLEENLFEILEISPKLQLSALESGQVDALFTVEPVCSFGINKGLGKLVYVDPIKHLSNTYAASVMSSKLADTKIARKLEKVTDDTIDFMESNPEKSLEIMAKHTGYKAELIKGMNVPIYSKSTKVEEEELKSVASALGMDVDVSLLIG